MHVIDDVDRAMLDRANNIHELARISRQPYPSTLGMFNIAAFISQDAPDYRQISPETSGTNITMPVGTLIVRQVLDADGSVTKITLMGKGPAGYDPTLGDWWFGVTDPAGVPITDATGLQVGKLTACHGCHIPRATDDFLFGVPKVDQ